MGSFRSWAARAGTEVLERLSFLLLAGLVGVVWSAVQVGLDSAAHRRIDAHPARIIGTVTEHHEPFTMLDWRHPYTVVYRYGSQSWRGRIPLGRRAHVGADVCLEVDATEPGRVRVCGSGVDLSNLRTAGTAIGILGTPLAIRWWLGRRRERDRHRAAAAEVQRVAAAIREQIRVGELPVGAALPGVEELAARHGTGESTVDAALTLLRDEGILRWRLGADGHTFERRVIREPATAQAD